MDDGSSPTDLAPLPTRKVVRAEIISLHKSATAMELGGMTAMADSNRRLGKMLARMQVEIEATARPMLTTVEEINALPDCAIIRLISEKKNLEKLDGAWYWPGVELPYTKVWETWLPAQLIYMPEVGE